MVYAADICLNYLALLVVQHTRLTLLNGISVLVLDISYRKNAILLSIMIFTKACGLTVLLGCFDFLLIKTHGSESRGQGGSTLRRPLDERT